jgi:nucleoside-diphosphate-sugar epimerase
LPAIDGKRPPLQFVHTDDVAAAFLAAVHGEAALDGAFNVAPDDWLPFEEVAHLRGVRVAPVPARWLAPLLDVGVELLPPRLRAPGEMLPYLRDPFVVANGKLRSATSWRPRFHSADALRAMLHE